MNEKLEQAKKEGRLLVFSGHSGEDYPVLLSIDRERSRILHAPDDTPPYEIHMVTRRTHLNPGESMTLAILFESKIPSMPSAAHLVISLHLSGLEWRFLINEPDRFVLSDEVLAMSEAYIAELKAQRKRSKRIIAKV